MSEEKNVYRCSLQFNKSDPVQKYALEILSQQGRHKSSFIARAVKFYVANSPDLRPVNAEPSELYIKNIENIVAQVLSEIQKTGGINIPQGQKESTVPVPTEVKEELPSAPKQISQASVAAPSSKPVPAPIEQGTDEDVDFALDNILGAF